LSCERGRRCTPTEGGPISLAGTMEQEVQGRTSPTEVGTWATELISLSLSGLVLGNTLTLMLDPLHSSTGVTSIVPVGDDRESLFSIDSFFDIFVELRLDTPTPLQTTRGPIHVSLVVPEPSSLALLAGGLIALASRRRRKAASG
jgi:hypothetical protein